MPDFLTENIPKSLLPLTVIALGFAIVILSYYITRGITKLIQKASKKKKTDVK